MYLPHLSADVEEEQQRLSWRMALASQISSFSAYSNNIVQKTTDVPHTIDTQATKTMREVVFFCINRKLTYMAPHRTHHKVLQGETNEI
jgi:hypothetical protein